MAHEKSSINNSSAKVHYSFNKSPRFIDIKPVTLRAHYNVKSSFDTCKEDSSAI